MADATKTPIEVTREQLYTQVWETPMTRLAMGYGISGNGLAKVCDRMKVPYAARVDQRKIGLGLTAFVSLSFEKKTGTQAEQIRKTIAAMPEVIGCYITSGEHDVLLQVVVADLDEYRKFSLDRLIKVPGIKDIHSSFALETVKENAPLPLCQFSNVQRTKPKN